MLIKNKELFFYYADWVMGHSRYGIIMMLLIFSSFTHDHLLATVLFIIFSIELAIRIPIFIKRIQTSGLFKRSLTCKMEWLMIGLDIIAVLSLLITVFQLESLLGDLALIRFVRGMYLLRTLRILRYIDLQSVIYSSTYGIVISIVVLVSFFAEGTLLWTIIVFLFIELAVRLIVQGNTIFGSKRDKTTEWVLWWMDVVATIAMFPIIAGTDIGSVLRALRLIRLLRPWIGIVRSLVTVLREGQFMQEVNLVVLLLAVLSIGSGVFAPLVIDDFDFDQDGVITERDSSVMANIWFAFRSFTDPGSVVSYTDSSWIVVFSILSVVAGVFLFSFFIGIGVNIVEGLTTKLRNETVNINNHIAMVGWNSASSHVLQQLQRFATRSFKQMKLVLLNSEQTLPEGFQAGSWATYRWGDMEDPEALKRISIGTASHTIINVPDGKSSSDELAYGFLSQLSIRRINPNVCINCVTPGDPHPRLAKYRHQLQVGWDKRDYYSKPISIQSQAEVRANVLKQVMFYYDFDQVLSLLMIPDRPGGSSLHVIPWEGQCLHEDGVCYLQTPDGQRIEIRLLVKALFKRGVSLLAMANEDMRIDNIFHPTRFTDVFALIGICCDAAVLHDQIEYVIRHGDEFTHIGDESRMIEMAPLALKTLRLRIAIVGRIGELPLILKRLLQDYEELKVSILDDMSGDERSNTLTYINNSLNEIEGAQERIMVDIIPWNFTDMAILEEHISEADRIFISRPAHVVDKPHATIASILSHVVSILDDYETEPVVFPVVDNREQARMLQVELHDFDADENVHVVVPDEFYGTYVAHTSFNMYTAMCSDDYRLQGSLHNVLEDLMSEAGEDDCFDVHGFKVESKLEKDPQALFNALLDQGNLWIGYRMDSSVCLDSKAYNALMYLFPRPLDAHCVRQEQIILNPFSSPLSQKVWDEMHDNIVELVTIRLAQPEEELLDDVFF